MKNAKPTKAKTAKSNKRFYRKQVRSLKRGHVKPLSLTEKMELKNAGRRDGQLGLPAEEDGIWRSPYLDEEVRKYEEFCYKTWGRLQLATEPHHARINLLEKTIPETEQALAEARKLLADQEYQLQLAGKIRKKGEENLTDELVRNRRRAEHAAQLLTIQSKVHALEFQLERDSAELHKLKSLLKELEITTSVICKRVEEHTKLRVAAYWREAMKYRQGEGTMPLTPKLEIHCEAEQLYRRDVPIVADSNIINEEV